MSSLGSIFIKWKANEKQKSTLELWKLCSFGDKVPTRIVAKENKRKGKKVCKCFSVHFCSSNSHKIIGFEVSFSVLRCAWFYSRFLSPSSRWSETVKVLICLQKMPRRVIWPECRWNDDSFILRYNFSTVIPCRKSWIHSNQKCRLWFSVLKFLAKFLQVCFWPFVEAVVLSLFKFKSLTHKVTCLFFFQ